MLHLQRVEGISEIFEHSLLAKPYIMCSTSTVRYLASPEIQCARKLRYTAAKSASKALESSEMWVTSLTRNASSRAAARISESSEARRCRQQALNLFAEWNVYPLNCGHYYYSIILQTLAFRFTRIWILGQCSLILCFLDLKSGLQSQKGCVVLPGKYFCIH